MKQGDFTKLASNYHNRPDYSSTVLNVLVKYTGIQNIPNYVVADVGAGTGKLTQNLLEMGLHCVAVEPNDSMRAEGIKFTSEYQINWSKGSAEETGLESSSANWILMGSSFHWVDTPKGLKEFHRVLREGGFFTAVWNPRDIESSPLHKGIEKKIYEIAPNIKRVSSGSEQYTLDMFDKLVSTGHFMDPVFVEAKHTITMSKERYLGAWRSVNDIAAQAGPEKFEQIMMAIEGEIKDLNEVVVPYKTRAWTAQRK